MHLWPPVPSSVAIVERLDPAEARFARPSRKKLRFFLSARPGRSTRATLSVPGDQRCIRWRVKSWRGSQSSQPLAYGSLVVAYGDSVCSDWSRTFELSSRTKFEEPLHNGVCNGLRSPRPQQRTRDTGFAFGETLAMLIILASLASETLRVSHVLASLASRLRRSYWPYSIMLASLASETLRVSQSPSATMLNTVPFSIPAFGRNRDSRFEMKVSLQNEDFFIFGFL